MAIAADTWLPEKRHSAIIEPDGDGYSGDQRCEDNGCRGRHTQVKGALAVISAHYTPALTHWLALAGPCARRARSFKCRRRECSINGFHTAPVSRCLIKRCQNRLERL